MVPLQVQKHCQLPSANGESKGSSKELDLLIFLIAYLNKFTILRPNTAGFFLPEFLTY